jgi:ribA/ribD-fused uncharacterized protein
MARARNDDLLERNGYLFFWNGWPSQWFGSVMVIRDITYNCCEQFMMAEKARVFGDRDCLEKILASNSPKEQKASGRKVRGFDEGVWNSVCRGIVYEGNLAKFSQNGALKRLLLATGSSLFVEASPFDRIWGIGLAKDDPRAAHPESWQGTNWLGIAIVQVREALRAQARGETPQLDHELVQQIAARLSLGVL